uniref:Uncharacterized protein n=1 Tax=Rhizophora mucronata TaxID=61149 RepID=A0A2P2NTU8_RHIMU
MSAADYAGAFVGFV